MVFSVNYAILSIYDNVFIVIKHAIWSIDGHISNWGPFYQHPLTLIPAWIRIHMPNKGWVNNLLIPKF